MGIALNIAALILVVGITWAGMMWLAGFVHRNRSKGGRSDLGDS